MWRLLLTYLFAAGAASALFILIGWRSSYVASATYSALRFDSEWKLDEASTEGTEMQMPSIDAALRLALKRLAPVISDLQINMDVSVSRYLTVQIPILVLANMLEELITVVIQHAPVDRWLVTAWEMDDRVAVRVTGDIVDADSATLQSAVHGMIKRVAFYGGTLDIGIQPIGTVLTIWLPRA